MIRATTIIAVKKDGKVAVAGDGQVTFGEVVFKSNAKKIRKIGNYEVLAGFAGAAADAFALMDKFENKLDEFGGNLKKASVELAKDWRTDKALRVLDAMLIVADKNMILILSGNGDVIEPDAHLKFPELPSQSIPAPPSPSLTKANPDLISAIPY